ncbi:GIY-YIG nuclease family protein [Rubinisphaera italica]|uniref:DUF4357 domain-containing protein n=1 Tax=Rubinisphaera italica TaxID=2527969 RepID=A0A5C5XI23_9PLAN|nr:GIY-YIG nuclease family protein [Rubinisphaera italica]TWT62856.1 hypothetical protein Pan54_36020 [Rubinisphaera italica]
MPDFQQRPYSIRIFVPDGDPDGLRMVEKSNWTGIGVVFKRTGYKQVVGRPEFDRTGIYVLVGFSEDSALPTINIGEGDSVKERLNKHYSNKDFWEWCVFFVTKDSSLNKAHVKHLESRLLELAKAAKQCKFDNTGSSLQPTLSEAERADTESFLLDMLSIFPLLGLSVFEKTETKKEPHDFFYIESKKVKASGYEDPKGFVVRSGSQLVKEEQATIHNYMSTQRKDLLEQGVVQEMGEHYIFKQDQVFGSPSTAAGVILGRTANGRIEWKTKDGVTLKQMQASTADTEDNDE